MNPVNGLQYLPPNPSLDQLQSAHSQWSDLETRRRLLLASFLLDSQRSTFFHQSPCPAFSALQPHSLPEPCSASAWECANLVAWRHHLLDAPAVAPSSSSSPFQASVHLHLSLLTPHATTTPPHLLSPPLDCNFNYHALRVATHTPIPTLLAVAAESWLFGRKVQDLGVWTEAKVRLRRWVLSEAASRAVWHAGFVLRAVVVGGGGGEGEETVDGGVEEGGVRRSESLGLGLHGEWCVYVAALVCWAYGYPSDRGAGAGSMGLGMGPSAEQFLKMLEGKGWRDVQRLRGDGRLWRGLGRAVRAFVGGERDGGTGERGNGKVTGDGGGKGKGKVKGKGRGMLLNEAERVLERLSEGRTRVCCF